MSRIPIEATLKTLATNDPPFPDLNIQSEESEEQEKNDVESLSKEAAAQAQAETVTRTRVLLELRLYVSRFRIPLLFILHSIGR